MGIDAHPATGATTMFAKTVIALSAVLVLGSATTAALAKSRANNPLAAFAQGGPAIVRVLSPVVNYDTSGAAIFRRPTRHCPLSLMQQSRC
jgi:hypothetical protein